ncbi:hypothetical protein JCM13591A_19290 [Microbacterium xylanilyticum]
MVNEQGAEMLDGRAWRQLIERSLGECEFAVAYRGQQCASAGAAHVRIDALGAAHTGEGVDEAV